MCSDSPARRSAFSLLELLIVIAIIGVLLGLVLVATNQMRASARSTHCLNNLRQLALGVRIYTDAHRGEFPDGAEEAWFVQIAPFVEQEPTVFRCPDDPSGAEQSYGYRDESVCLPEASLAGKRIDFVASNQLVMIFDTFPGWHTPERINVSRVDTAGLAMEEEAFEENLLLGAEQGSFLNLDLPAGMIPEEQ